MVGGVLVNALIFTCSNFLCSHMGGDSAAERVRHDKYKHHRLHGANKEQND